MENLPRLLPVWQNSALQKFMGEHEKGGRYVSYRYDPKFYADYGGIGVDVSHDEDFEVSIKPVKYYDAKRSNGNYIAKSCTLPFSHPNLVQSSEEHCLEPLMEENRRTEEFFKTLRCVRGHLKPNTQLFNSIQEVQEMLCRKKKMRNKIHPSILKLIEKLPNNLKTLQANWLYTGGCLTSASSQDKTLLLHPCGKEYNNLAISQIGRKLKSESPDRHGQDREENCLYEENCILLELPETCQGPIYQLSAVDSESETICCARYEKSNQLISLPYQFDGGLILKGEFSYDDRICYTSLSPHIEGEFVTVTEGGKLLLQNWESEKPMWKLQQFHELDSDDQWWTCDFARHPRHILLTDRSMVCILDTRTRNKLLSTLCNIHSGHFLKDEWFFLTKMNPLNSCQHFLASTRQLSLWDERFKKEPVMMWNHFLDSFPVFLDTRILKSSSSTEMILLMGSQQSQDVTAYHLNKGADVTVQPISLAPPWALSQPQDIIHHLKTQGVNINEFVCKRLTAPLIGACCIETEAWGEFATFQLTSFCDLFFQEYFLCGGDREKNFKFGPGCPVLASDELEKNYQWWAESAVISDYKKKRPCSLKWSFHTSKHVDLDLKKFSKHCPFHTFQRDNEDMATNSDVCEPCGLDVKISNALLTVMKKKRVLGKKDFAESFDKDDVDDASDQDPISDLARSLSVVDLTAPWDKFSVGILNQWISEEFPEDDVMGLSHHNTFISNDPEGLSEIFLPSECSQKLTSSLLQAGSYQHKTETDQVVSTQDHFQEYEEVYESFAYTPNQRLKIPDSQGF